MSDSCLRHDVIPVLRNNTAEAMTRAVLGIGASSESTIAEWSTYRVDTLESTQLQIDHAQCHQVLCQF